MKPSLTLLPALLALASAGLTPASAADKPAVAPNSGPAPKTSSSQAAPEVSFDSFRLITQRNIFNPNRYASSGRTRSDEAAPVTPAFNLVGILLTGEKTLAFFDGTESQYRKVLKVGAQIAGFTLTKIEANSIELTREGKALTLAVTQGMTQGDNNTWSPTSRPSTASSATSSESPSASGSTNGSGTAPAIPADASDTLRRLMEARQKQLKE